MGVRAWRGEHGVDAGERAVEVLIVYYSRYGAIAALAQRIAEGVHRVPEARAHLIRVEDQPIDEPRAGEDEHAAAVRRAALLDRLVSADAIIVGAPSYFGTMASPMKRFFEDVLTAAPSSHERTRPWRHYLLRDKVGAAFTASGTPHGGNEQTLHSILTLFMHLGMIIVTPGQQSPVLENEAAPYGATTISGPEGSRPPEPLEEESARNLGQRVAEVAAHLKLGRLVWLSGVEDLPGGLPPSPLDQSHTHPRFWRQR